MRSLRATELPEFDNDDWFYSLRGPMYRHTPREVLRHLYYIRKMSAWRETGLPFRLRVAPLIGIEGFKRGGLHFRYAPVMSLDESELLAFRRGLRSMIPSDLEIFVAIGGDPSEVLVRPL